MPSTQEEIEKMCTVYETQADRGAWGRWETLYLDLARERKDKSVGDLLSKQDDATHPVPWTLSSAGRAGLLPHGALAGARTGQML